MHSVYGIPLLHVYNFWIKFPINTTMHNLWQCCSPLLLLVSHHQCTHLCLASPVVADLLRLLYDNHLHLIQDILQQNGLEQLLVIAGSIIEELLTIDLADGKLELIIIKYGAELVQT